MNSALLKSLLGASGLTMLAVGSAAAGGLERGGYNIDLLFDPSRFASEVTATYVSPQRDLQDVRDINASNGIGSNGRGAGATSGIRDTEDYTIPRVGLKAGMGPVDCMVDYSQPWGADINPGRNWIGANSNIDTHIESHNYAGTCSYKFDAGKGQFRVLGGVFYQEVEGYKERLVVGGLPAFLGTGVGRLDLSGEGVGWRGGVAYEIPEIALRASLVYNSEVDLGDITGTLNLTQISPAVLPPGDPRRAIFGRITNVTGRQSMPDSVEFKVQSGIAPDWLAFGSIKWVDWSTFQEISFCVVGDPRPCTTATDATSLELLYRDGWTVTGGVGHKFNEQWSGAASIAWDRGTATTLGTQSDTWTLSGGAAFTPSKNVELRFGGAVGVLTSGSSIDSEIAYNYDNDFVGALSGSLKIKF